jgi:hypothetical protein
MKIPGIVFLITGIILSFVSSHINKTNDSASLTIFILIGYLFIAYGAAKMIINYILKKDRKAEDSSIKKNNLPENLQTHPKLKQEYQTSRNNPAPVQNAYSYTGYCSNCGTPMRSVNKFCHICGTRQQ